MSRILVISSWVARGHVGLSAAVPVLNGLGHDTVALPTVMLSNHLGHPHCAGAAVPVAQLEAMFEALAANGWLADIAAVLTGYFPSADHVVFAAQAVARIRGENPNVHVCCDPVLGDDPDGLYVPSDVADAVRARLLPLCRTVTPIRFELEWLSGMPVACATDAAAAARGLGPELALVTSVMAGTGEVANVLVTDSEAWTTATPWREGVPHGTGDVLAAAMLAGLLDGSAPADALARSVAQVDAIIAASVGADELQVTGSRGLWMAASAVTARRMC